MANVFGDVIFAMYVCAFEHLGTELFFRSAMAMDNVGENWHKGLPANVRDEAMNFAKCLNRETDINRCDRCRQFLTNNELLQYDTKYESFNRWRTVDGKRITHIFSDDVYVIQTANAPRGNHECIVRIGVSGPMYTTANCDLFCD